MSNTPEYFNVKINVGGNIHDVKIEKGVRLRNTSSGGEAIFRVEGDNKITGVNIDWSKNTAKAFNAVQINMTEAQFSIFSNVADNIKENGNDIILSQDDIEKAEKLYRSCDLVKDISKNIPNEYSAVKKDQYLYPGEFARINCCLGNNKTGEREDLGFYLKADRETNPIIDIANAYPDTEVKIDYWTNSSLRTLSIKAVDDNGVTHVYNGYDSKRTEKYREYDENGKHVIIYNDGAKRIKYTDEEGHRVVKYIHPDGRESIEEKSSILGGFSLPIKKS